MLRHLHCVQLFNSMEFNLFMILIKIQKIYIYISTKSNSKNTTQITREKSFILIKLYQIKLHHDECASKK